MTERTLSRTDLLLGFWLGPMRALWWLFSNVRWAMGIIAFIAAVSLLGVFLPQIPTFMRGNPAAEEAWVEFQRGKFGPLTDFMYRVGLFDIFHARWFAVSLGLMLASTGVYIINRLPAIWLSITRPRKQVPDAYFENAPHRFDFPTSASAEELVILLRRKRYKVEVFPESKASYIFADRFAWAQLGTLLTHASVIIFVLAAVVSRASGFSVPLFIPEGGTAPVIPVVSHPDQMQVKVLDAVGVFGEDGLPIDYRTEMAIYQDGQEVKRCSSTVNSPCEYQGYRFHQAAYYGFGAEVQVRDLTSGNVVYHETLSLSDRRAAPRVVARDAASKQVLFDDTPVLGPAVSTRTAEGEVVAALSRIAVLTADLAPRGFIIGLKASPGGDSRLLVLEPGNPLGNGLELKSGESKVLGSLEFQFAGIGEVPAIISTDIPLPGGSAPAEGVLLQMSNVVYGTGTASAGGGVQAPPTQGEPTLTMLGIGSDSLVLKPGETRKVGNLEYTFLERKEFSGLQVKKDNSDNLVWIAMSLLLAGLLISFWVPRRRLWAKITSERTYFVGQTSQMANLRRELRQLARESGAAVEESEE
ncbi:MAG TPA: cytochrome c biogenesis protein ResB [Dehalococcoidia bacterium]|nr:cytochrome c biogenesis protein ResB [Dehalococcoidia bacterium]